MKRLIFIWLSMLWALCGFSQNDTVIKDYGDVSPKDFEPTAMELLGGYKAVILQNTRDIYFDLCESYLYGNTNLRFCNTYHVRYKALEDDFFEDNKFVVPYSGRFDFEFVKKIRATVYSYQDHKKVSKKNIKFKNIKYFDMDSIRSRVEVVFPHIKKGDIVEIEYTVASYNFVEPDRWDFHNEYPCCVSQVKTDFPNFITYDYLVTGDEIPINEDVKHHVIVMTVYAKPMQDPRPRAIYGSPTNMMFNFKLNAEQHIFTAMNTVPIDTNFNFMPQRNYNDAQFYLRPKRISDEVSVPPGLIDEWRRFSGAIWLYAEPGNRYLKPIDAYRRSTNTGLIKFESENWKRFTKRQRQSPEFWKPIQKYFALDGELSNIFERDDVVDSLAFLKRIHGYIASHVKWDSTFANYISKNPEDILRDGRGSSADINATLVSIMRRAGFVSLPVYSATRDFGMVDSAYVNVRQFNNILAFVSFSQDGVLHNYVIDATSPTRSFDVLNTCNINNLYLAMDLDSHIFISGRTDLESERKVTAYVEDGGCVLNEKSTGVFAAESGDFLYGHSAKQYVDNNFYFDHAAVQPVSNSIKDGVFELCAKVSTPSSDAKQVMLQLMGPNPFPELVRTVPVDFIFPRKYRYVVYSDESLSVENKELSISNGNLKARIYSGNTERGNALHVDIDIVRPMFYVFEYDDLRSLYAMIYEVLGGD